MPTLRSRRLEGADLQGADKLPHGRVASGALPKDAKGQTNARDEAFDLGSSLRACFSGVGALHQHSHENSEVHRATLAVDCVNPRRPPTPPPTRLPHVLVHQPSLPARRIPASCCPISAAPPLAARLNTTATPSFPPIMVFLAGRRMLSMYQSQGLPHPHPPKNTSGTNHPISACLQILHPPSLPTTAPFNDWSNCFPSCSSSPFPITG